MTQTFTAERLLEYPGGYTRSVGPVIGRFLTGLRDGRLLAVRLAGGRVLVPPASARFGVISDIDDTVLWTNVRNKLKMVLTIALLNERTRVPFQGVAAFYRALQQGAGGNENNPIFYVSGSAWNLYDLLVEFFQIHGIPLGPILLLSGSLDAAGLRSVLGGDDTAAIARRVVAHLESPHS